MQCIAPPQKLFGAGLGSLRESIVQIVHGARFQDHPEVQKERRKAMFLSSTEVSIERDHALMHAHIKTAPYHSEAYASIQVRKHEILPFVERSAEHLQSFCDRLSQARTPNAVAVATGLFGPPQHR